MLQGTKRIRAILYANRMLTQRFDRYLLTNHYEIVRLYSTNATTQREINYLMEGNYARRGVEY
jgi:hypothetical protein